MEQIWNQNTISSVVDFLTFDERCALRATSRIADAYCRCIPFARAIRIKPHIDRREDRSEKTGWKNFAWAQFEQLRSKFNFTSLRLLQLDLSAVRTPRILEAVRYRGVEPYLFFEDLRKLLDSQHQLLLVLFNDCLPYYHLADALPEFGFCDRWSIFDDYYFWQPTQSVEAADRMLLYELQMKKSMFKDGRRYPLLRRLVFQDHRVGATDGLEKWLAESSAPVLSAIDMKGSRGYPPASFTEFAVQRNEELWTGGEWTVAWRGGGVPNPEFCRMLRALKGNVRVSRCNMQQGCATGKVIGDKMWQQGLDTLHLGPYEKANLEEEGQRVGDGIPCNFTNLRRLIIGEFDFSSVEQWRCLFGPSSLPALKVLEIESVRKPEYLVRLFEVLAGREFGGLTSLQLGGTALGRVLECYPKRRDRQLPCVRLPRLTTFKLILTFSSKDRDRKVGRIFEALDAALRTIFTSLTLATFEDLQPILAERFPDAEVKNDELKYE